MTDKTGRLFMHEVARRDFYRNCKNIFLHDTNWKYNFQTGQMRTYF